MRVRPAVLKGIWSLIWVLITAASGAQNLVVGEYFFRTAQEFTPDGRSVGPFATTSGVSRFCGMAFDHAGNLYVAGVQTQNIRLFCANGRDQGNFLTGLNIPLDVALDAQGNVYVSCAGDNTIQRYSPQGDYLGVFAVVPTPDSLAFDRAGNLYVSSYGTHSVYRISADGREHRIFAHVHTPAGLALDPDGYLYVASAARNQIRRIAPDGTDLGVFASTGIQDPRGIAIGPDGCLYVANYGYGRGSTVRRFSPGGTDLGDFARGLHAPVDLAFRPGAGLHFSLSGRIVLQESQSSADVPITFVFRPLFGCSVFTRVVTPAPDGRFYIAHIPFGRYDVAAKGVKWLRHTLPIDLMQNVHDRLFYLHAGDADGNNRIDMQDFYMLLRAFDSGPGAPHWDPLADFNCDGAVDVLDLDLLIRNFDMAGDP
ncbi:MAG: dockerin type I domain-containing protein [Chloroherpetonaceae bacterium]|nr:dockerin type I domain-containing protein [Chthonomonadaceae bacterium]MDW8206571.1 dockerin type I domain-containing protein [Chloroherpetonaceae bacterium]